MDVDHRADVPASWAEARPLLRPVLRPSSYLNGIADEGKRACARQLWPFVHEVVVVDLSEVRALVTPDDIAGWGVPAYEAFAVARENLPADRISIDPGETVSIRDTGGDTYADSLILAAGWLAGLQLPGGPRPLVFFPGDGALVAGTDAPEDGPGLFDVAETMYLDARQPISPQGYTIEAGVTVPFELAGPHPLRRTALRARTLLFAREYEAQTVQLRARYEDDLLVQYVGAAQAVQTAWGPRTVAVWGEGIPWELPLADYVTFMAGEPGQATDSFTVPFATVVDVVGILPVPGLDPVRYRAEEWPTPDLLAILKAHSVQLSG